jgi:preprotein translocase subunit SecY
MNRLIQTFKNIWSIPELKQRLLYTLALLFVFRVGTFILLPGVNAQVLASMAQQSAGRTDLLGLLNTFTGGAFAKGAIFALGVMPYITASIIIQLLTFAVPYFQRLQQHEGESGRKKLNQMTRFLTIGVTMVQGSGYLTYLTTQNAIATGLSPALFWFSGIVILTAGTVFAMWLGERITEKGLGNGTSFIIMSGIIDQFPQSIAAEFQLQSGFGFVIEMAIWCAIVLGIIVL